MTTQYKITRADITADASQNREQMFKFDPNTPEPFKRYKGEYGQLKQGTKVWCNGYAGAIVRHYDGATYEIRVPGGVVATDQFELTDERILSEPPVKPANAQAASAHTPSFKDLLLAVLDQDGFAFDLCLKKYTETAAERDRLKAELAYARKMPAELSRQLDQAREQVKTLLKACRDARSMIQQFDIAFEDETDDPLPIIAQLDAAIASIESEQAK